MALRRIHLTKKKILFLAIFFISIAFIYVFIGAPIPKKHEKISLKKANNGMCDWTITECTCLASIGTLHSIGQSPETLCISPILDFCGQPRVENKECLYQYSK